MFTFTNGKEKFRKSDLEDKLSVIVSGDCCPWDSAIEQIQKGSSKNILKGIQGILDSADVSIIQWETPLTNADTPITKSGPNLKCPPECLDFLKAGGFDIALLANNHTGDYGQEPVTETINLLNTEGIKTVGAGSSLEEAEKPLIFEKNGFKIAILNVAEHEFGTAGPENAGCAPLKPVENIITVKRLADENNITIVVIHGGNEHNPVPSPRMMRNCRAFADAGASAIINIHTHCPQGIECRNGVPIIYSPGNFFFPFSNMDFDKENFWWTGYLPKLQFDHKGAVEIEIAPYTFSPDPWSIDPLTGKEKERFLLYLSKISSILVSQEKVNQYFDVWSVIHGAANISRLATCASLWPLDYNNPEAVKNILPMRNLFTCEAHNELTTNFLRIVEEFRISEVEKFIPEIKKLQKAIF